MPPDLISLLGALAAIALVLVGAYAFTRWAGTRLSAGPIPGAPGRRMKVLDRAIVGRDQSILVVRAGERYFLLGSTPAGLSLLAELSREEGESFLPPPPSEGALGPKGPDFQAILQRLREKNKTEKR